MFDRFTEQARSALVLAETEAQRAGADAVGSVHLALACLGQEESDVDRLLSHHDVLPEMVAGMLRVEPVVDPRLGKLPISDVVRQELVAAMRLAMDTGRTMVTSAHVLVAILMVDPHGEVGSVLRSLGASLDRLAGGLGLAVSGEFISSGQNPADPA